MLVIFSSSFLIKHPPSYYNQTNENILHIFWSQICVCVRVHPPVGKAAALAQLGCRRSPRGTEQGGARPPAPY